MAGHGAFCAVAYHRGLPSGNTQQIEVRVASPRLWNRPPYPLVQLSPTMQIRLFLHKGGAQDSAHGDAGAFASTLQPRRLGTVHVSAREGKSRP